LSHLVTESTEEARRFYQQAGRRFVAHFQALAHSASGDLKPQLRWEKAKHGPDSSLEANLQRLEQQAIATLEQERANLLHAIGLAHLLQEWALVCQVADHLAVFFNTRSYWSDWVQTAELAVAAAKFAADLRLEAGALNNLGVVYRQLERLSEAADCSRRSLDLCRQLGDRQGEGLALGNLGGVCFAEKDLDTSREHYEAALHIFEELGDQHGQAQSLMGIGISLARQRRPAEAVSPLEACLNIQRRIGDRFGEAQTLNNFGIVQRLQGQLPEAIASFQASLRIKQALGDQQGAAWALSNLAIAYQQSGAVDQAIAAWEEALALLNNLHLSAAERVAQRVARARSQRQGQQEDNTSAV
jgi:tetratricopeptide (TPR) repeat protein